MKTHNLESTASHGNAAARGRQHTGRAGSPGIRFIDNSAGVDTISATVHLNRANVLEGEDGDEVFLSDGAETPYDHGDGGSGSTVDLDNGLWHQILLTADCAVTIEGFVAALGMVMVVKVTQDGTGGWAITWDADVIFAGDDQPDQAPNAVTWYVLWSDEGDSVIYGSKIGGGGAGASTLDDLTDVTITAAATDDTLRYNGSAWINDNRRWEAVTDGEDVFVWVGDDLVHEWETY